MNPHYTTCTREDKVKWGEPSPSVHSSNTHLYSYGHKQSFSQYSTQSRHLIDSAFNESSSSSGTSGRDSNKNEGTVGTLMERKNGVGDRLLVDPGTLGIPLAKSVSNTTPVTGPRRRSHRPRGCRGGRKNRKSQQAKAQALIPKEILEAVSTGSSPSPPSSTLSNSSAAPADKESKTMPTASKTQVEMNVLDTLPDAKLLKWKDSGSSLWADPTAATGSTAKGGLPFMNQSYGVAAAFALENRSKVGSDSSSSFPMSHSLPTFRSVPAAKPSNTNSQLFRGEQTPSPPPAPPTEILPPSNPVQTQPRSHSPPLPIMTGPNPYALSSSSMGSVASTRSRNTSAGLVRPMARSTLKLNTGATNHASTGSVLPYSLPPKPQNNNNNNNNNSTLPKKVTVNSAFSASDDYRSHRIQKQRQMPNGGSLFVTSPRSFLLGRPTDSTPVSW